MIADLKPYPAMKDSEVPWLGIMPSHWNVLRLGSVLRERAETNEQKQITQVLSVLKDVGVIRYEDKGRIGNKKSEDIRRYKIVRLDDIVVNCMNVIIGSVGRSRYIGCLSPVYYVLTRRSETDNPRYLAAIFAAKPFHKSLVRIGNGILAHRMRIPMELLKCEPLPIPPPDEQAAIVRFLGWATGRLDRAIRAKQKIIALLNEQKQAIIHRAVTGQIDVRTGKPYPAYKPSGIPWLGEIPQHWDMPRLGRLLKRIDQGWSPVAAEGEILLNQWTVLTLSSVRRGIFNPAAIKPVSLTASIPTGIEVSEGDVLLTRSNTRDRVGDVCIVRKPRPKTILCDLIYRLQIHPGAIEPQFLVFQLLSRVGRGQIERDARGSSGTMPKISKGHIKSWFILRPPAEEQQRIIESINLSIDTAIDLTERGIALLREYRTRLVADVVTGKLDVREAAARLPEVAPCETMENGTNLDDEINPTDEEAVE